MVPWIDATAGQVFDWRPPVTRLHPPALDLPDEGAVRWTSFTKVIRRPEENWPIQICERPLIARRVGGRTIALIADPEAAQTVLSGSEQQFPKWRIYERVVGAGAGRESLSATAGAQWRRQRRAFSPMFRPENTGRLVPLFRRAADRAIARWEAHGKDLRLDLCLEMTRLTLEVTWEVLFGRDSGSPAPSFVTRAAAEIHAAQLRGEVNTPAVKIAELADAAARRAPVQGMVRGNPFDAWGTVTSDASPDGLTAQELYDNARNFLGAGHETTALTLTWALWLVAQDQDAQRRIHDELDDVVGIQGIEDAHMARLGFTSAVLSETLRLFPPALVTVRQSTEPVELAGELLPRGAILVVCIYALHRHHGWWAEPDSFWPDRFAAAGEPRHRYAYLPFSAGQHACIGVTFGWKEAVAIFATILQHFRVATDSAVAVRPRMTITLRPDREVPIILHRRR